MAIRDEVAQGLGDVDAARLATLAQRAVLFDQEAYATKNITSADTPYTLTEFDHTLFIDTDGGLVTVNLLPAARVPGITYVLKKETNSGNKITVDPDGSETLDGNAALIFGASLRESIVIRSDGVEWWVVAEAADIVAKGGGGGGGGTGDSFLEWGM